MTRTDTRPLYVDKIKMLDTTVFAIQRGHYSDRTSFLRVQRLVGELHPGYAYSEIGSHIGGSLLPHLLDPSCALALSIDPRAKLQPDERGKDFLYVGNSTARMMAELSKHASPAELGKLPTIEADASAIEQAKIGMCLNLVLIDGEHTNLAAFADFMVMLPLLATHAVVTFHDANLIGDTIQIIVRFLLHQQIPYSLVILPSCVAVFGFGAFLRPVETDLAPHAEPMAACFAKSIQQRQIAVADAVIERTAGLRSSSIAELIVWSADAEQRSAAVADSAVAEVVGLRHALKQAEADNAARQRQIDAFANSASWKITAPLRAVALRFKGHG